MDLLLSETLSYRPGQPLSRRILPNTNICMTLLQLIQRLRATISTSWGPTRLAPSAPVYRAERATLRAFGPGRVLALRIMRNKDRREVLRVPLTLRLEAREFRLRAGVCHSGSSYQCGHYTCLAPLSDGKQWVLCDDGTVQVCSVPKELCLASRVLFYELAELATEPTGQMEASRLEVAKTEEELVAPALPEDAAPAIRASGEQNVHVEEVPGALVADGEGDAANWKSAVADESVVAAASLTHALEEVAEGMETTCGPCDEELKCWEHMRVGRGQDALEHDL